jgi:hypothetical protein
MVGYTCNPRCLGDRDERITVRGQPGQKVIKTCILTNTLGMVAGSCNPSCVGGTSRRIMFWASSGKNVSSYLKNN